MNKERTYDQLFVTSQAKMEEIMKVACDKCTNDKIFEQAMLNDPTETLKKEGLELQPGISFQIVKTEKEAKLLPDNVISLIWGEQQDSLSIEDLNKVSAGADYVLYKHNPVATPNRLGFGTTWTSGGRIPD